MREVGRLSGNTPPKLHWYVSSLLSLVRALMVEGMDPSREPLMAKVLSSVRGRGAKNKGGGGSDNGVCVYGVCCDG